MKVLCLTATLEHELEKRAELDLKRIEQEVLSKGKVERDNHHLTLEQIRLKAKEDRATRLESIRQVFSERVYILLITALSCLRNFENKNTFIENTNFICV